MNSNPPEKIGTVSDDFIEAEIHDLEQRLEHAKSRLRARKAGARNGVAHHFHNEGGTHQQLSFTLNGEPPPPSHYLRHFTNLASSLISQNNALLPPAVRLGSAIRLLRLQQRPRVVPRS